MARTKAAARKTPPPESLGASESWRSRALAFGAAAVVLAGAVLRLYGARGDLWLDEIWSLQLTRSARNALDVFVLHHDNNDYLNTVWMLWVGPAGSPFLHRALSVASGAALVALGAGAPLRVTRLDAFLTALLLAGSRFLVHYGSEARGYGPAMFFALAAFVALSKFLATRSRRWAAAFGASAALGLLSHLTFVFVLAGAGAWLAVELWRARVTRSAVTREAVADAALLALPVLLLGLLWLVDIRFLEVGGAPPDDRAAVLPDLAAAALGLPKGPLRLLAFPFAGFALFELWSLARERDTRWVFFAALFLSPLPYLVLVRPEHVLPRHFAVLVPLFLTLLAAGLARVARLGWAGAAAAAVALLVFALGNAVHLALLIRDGRGHYREAVELILANSPSGRVTVGSFHDFRNKTVLDDQLARLGAADRVEYVASAKLAETPPQWLLMIDFDPHPQLREYLDLRGHFYSLAGVFPYAGLSGWTWLVYKSAPTPRG